MLLKLNLNNYNPYLLFFLFISFASFSQQTSISGEVSIMNSKVNTGKKVFVQYAQVEEDFGRSQATTTDADGRFNLQLVNVKEKETIRFSITKDGLEVINLDKLKAIAGQSEMIKIYMANPKSIADNRKKYYEVGVTTAEKKMTRKITKLRNEIKQLNKNEDKNINKILELQNQIAELQSNFNLIEERARKLADKYSRINLDDADEMLQDAFKYFQEGDFDKALEVFNDNKLIEKTEKGLDRREKIERARQILDSLDNQNERNIQNLIPSLLFKADLHELLFQPDSVEYCFNFLLKMDPDNIEILEKYGDFNLNQNKFDIAIQTYEKGLPLVKPLEKIKLKHIIGITYFLQADFEKAQKTLGSSLQMLASFDKNDPETLVLLNKIHLSLAQVFNKREILDDAYNNYKISQTYAEKLVELDRDLYLPILARTYEYMGYFFLAHNWHENDYENNTRTADSYTYSQKAIEIYKELKGKNIDMNNEYANRASALQNQIHFRISRAQGIKGYGKDYKDYMLSELNDNKEYVNLPYQHQLHINLGNIYYMAGDGENAPFHFKKALEIANNLATKNPDRYRPLLAESKYSWGNYNMKTGDKNNITKKEYQQALRIADQNYHLPEMQDLSEKILQFVNIEEVYPKYKDWEKKAEKLNTIRYYHTRTLPQDRERTYYEEDIKIQKKIFDIWLEAFEDDPINPHYKKKLSLITSGLAESNLFVENFEETEKYARQSMKLNKRDGFASVYLTVALLFQSKMEECKSNIIFNKKQPYIFNKANYRGMNPGWLIVFKDALLGLQRKGIVAKDLNELKDFFHPYTWIEIETPLYPSKKSAEEELKSQIEKELGDCLAKEDFDCVIKNYEQLIQIIKDKNGKASSEYSEALLGFTYYLIELEKWDLAISYSDRSIESYQEQYGKDSRSYDAMVYTLSNIFKSKGKEKIAESILKKVNELKISESSSLDQIKRYIESCMLKQDFNCQIEGYTILKKYQEKLSPKDFNGEEYITTLEVLFALKFSQGHSEELLQMGFDCLDAIKKYTPEDKDKIQGTLLYLTTIFPKEKETIEKWKKKNGY